MNMEFGIESKHNKWQEVLIVWNGCHWQPFRYDLKLNRNDQSYLLLAIKATGYTFSTGFHVFCHDSVIWQQCLFQPKTTLISISMH